MGEDSKKSFWTSMLGILTGIAAIIVAVGSIITALYVAPTTPESTTSPETTPTPETTPFPTSQSVCGAQLQGVNLFGSWDWVGTNKGIAQAGLLTFKGDCTYENIAISGFTGKDEGSFNVGISPPTIKLQNKEGEEHTYYISQVSEKSFRMSDPVNKVSLVFDRAS